MPATRPGAPGQSARTTNEYFHESISCSASEVGDGSVFDEEESEDSQLDEGEEGTEEGEESESESTPNAVSLRRIDTIGQFEQGVVVEVVPDAVECITEANAEAQVMPRRLLLPIISSDTAAAAGEFLAGALGCIDTPKLRVTPPAPEMRAPPPALPAALSAQSSVDSASGIETPRGTQAALPFRRIDTMDFLRVPTCEPSPMTAPTPRAGFPSPESYPIPPNGLRSTDSLDMLKLPSAEPSPVPDRPIAKRRREE